MISRGRTLHLVLGPWGSGKSTLVQRLAELLPECVVFDWDLIIPGLSLNAGKDVFTQSLLSERGELEGNIRSELAEAAELRTSGYVRFDCTRHPYALAKDVAAWVLGVDS
jgi:energy-coupling factor transporter ATP-binding protein EcfA2